MAKDESEASSSPGKGRSPTFEECCREIGVNSRAALSFGALALAALAIEIQLDLNLLPDHGEVLPLWQYLLVVAVLDAAVIVFAMAAIYRFHFVAAWQVEAVKTRPYGSDTTPESEKTSSMLILMMRTEARLTGGPFLLREPKSGEKKTLHSKPYALWPAIQLTGVVVSLILLNLLAAVDIYRQVNALIRL